jgi:hypothetical protein
MLAVLAVTVTTGGYAQQKKKFAVVVGVNTYVSGIPRLYGTKNDCDDIKNVLESRGFQVTHLQDDIATYAKIENAILELSQKSNAFDEFVYFQSSHGSRNGVLLTSDSPTDLSRNVISKKTLDDWMTKFKCGKTVILDACFSGALGAKSLRTRGGENRVKYYEGTGSGLNSKDLDVVVTSDTERKSNSEFPVFTSSSSVQASFENDLNGRSTGIFTRYLVDRLKTELKPETDVRWSSIVGHVVKQVSDSVPQTPSFTQQFSGSYVFNNRSRTGSSGVDVKSLREYVDIENPNSEYVSTTISSASLKRGEKIKLYTTVKTAGYIVYLSYDSEDRGRVTDLAGKPIGSKVPLSNAGMVIPLDVSIPSTGNTLWEKIKVYWFGDENSALEFAKKFEESKPTIAGSKLVDFKPPSAFDLTRVFTTSHMIVVKPSQDKQ